MKTFFTRMAFLALIASFGLMTALSAAPKPEEKALSPKTGFIAAILSDFDGVGKKLEDLAGAIPADKYSWSPAKGVRSVGEVYKHVAGANYFFMGFLGVKPPANAMPDPKDSVASKDQVVKILKPSLDAIRTVISGLSEKDLDKTTEMFGQTVSYRTVLMTEIGHLHEHLGQAIAYARMNNIVPPWTAPEPPAK
jgi:uncharacterized damage-inducible protein DinB